MYAQVLPDSGVQIVPKEIPTAPAPLPTEEYPKALDMADQASKYKRRVIDLLAIPHKGETYVGANYEYTKSKTYRGGDDDIRGKSNQVNIAIERSLTENLSAQAQLGYLLADATYYGSKNLGNSKGVTDPVLGINYRALDISRDRYDLNLNPYFSPSIQDATSSSGGKDGNGTRGYSYMGIKTGFGRREGVSSWALNLELFQAFSGRYKDAETGDKTKTSSWQGIAWSGNYLKTLTPKFSIEGEIGSGWITGIEYTAKNGDKSHTNSKTLFSISGTGYYEFVTNNFFTSSIGWSGSTDEGFSKDSNAEWSTINTNTSRFSLIQGYLTQF